MSKLQLLEEMRFTLEGALQDAVSTIPAGELREMLTYHMGWTGEGNGIEAQGKRIRPLLTLLTCEGTGGQWRNALPAAVAIELVHNFSLIHDDIEDNSDLRRGRKTVWKKWGISQAINFGDLVYSLARINLLELRNIIPTASVLTAAECLDKTCISLTYGQYMDIEYEQHPQINLDDYYKMISGKTAALINCCAKMGGIISGASSETIQQLGKYGQHLGMAFQMVDDWLGVWGDMVLTGKSTVSDLVNGKKSAPIIYGLEHSLAFAKAWQTGIGSTQESSKLAGMLVELGASEYVSQQADYHTKIALNELENAISNNEIHAILDELTRNLLNRKK